jgi:hypothetical protein
MIRLAPPAEPYKKRVVRFYKILMVKYAFAKVSNAKIVIIA